MELKDKLNIEVYLVENGMLLPKDDREYECYSQVYDKKNGYYDEFIGCCIGPLDELKKDLIKDMNEYYCPNTYTIIVKKIGKVKDFNLNDEDLKEIENINDLRDIECYLNRNIVDVTEYSFKSPKVIFSAYKDDQGVIHENFVGE